MVDAFPLDYENVSGGAKHMDKWYGTDHPGYDLTVHPDRIDEANKICEEVNRYYEYKDYVTARVRDTIVDPDMWFMSKKDGRKA